MERTSIFVTPEQKERLRAAATETGLKPAELVRRFIDEGLDRHEKKQAKKESK